VSSEDTAHLLQLVMAQLQMRAAQESGCDPASDSNAESNEPSGCCADADIKDRNGLDMEICVKLGDEVTAAM
jgi:hypothetical protein